MEVEQAAEEEAGEEAEEEAEEERASSSQESVSISEMETCLKNGNSFNRYVSSLSIRFVSFDLLPLCLSRIPQFKSG